MNELDLIKLNIYEAYDNGEITYEEKEYLLEAVLDKFKDKIDTCKEISMHKAKIAVINDYINDQNKIGGFKANAKKGIATLIKQSENKKIKQLKNKG